MAAIRKDLRIPFYSLLAVATLSYPTLTLNAQTPTPSSLSFGNWVVQTTSKVSTVVLKNTQTVAMTISNITVSGDFGETSNCPVSPKALAAGASCKLLVTFTPSVLGARTGIVSVYDNVGNSPQTMQLSGNGVVPVGLSPSSLAFGSQGLNTTSAVRVLTLQNNQTVPLIIAGISTSGDFSQTSNCPLSPNTLPAKGGCKISVTFTPTALGTRTGVVTVSDNAVNSPQAAEVTGNGIAAIGLSPSSLSFTSQIINTNSIAKTITLSNKQAVPLTIFSVSTSGDFAQNSTCPAPPNTLAVGASCTISVTFTPTALGSRTGILTILSSGSSPTVNLSGTGTLAGLLSISVTPTNPKLSTGSQQQFVAIGAWPSGTANISQFVNWTSSEPSVASVSLTGLAQAVNQGTAAISASYGSISGSTTITVTPPALTSITVTPGSPSAPVGAYDQFTAVLNYSDGSTKNVTSSVSWSSSATTVANITSSGLASALAAGTTTITATAESVTGSTTMVVSQPQCVSPPAGLVGWWTGDGNTVDIAGSNSGTLQNGATYSTGEIGQAFSFAGNGAFLLVNSSVYSPTAGTLMFWFLPNGSGALTGSYDGTNRTPGLSVDTSGNLNWEFGNLAAQPIGQVPFNQWSHVALSYATFNSQLSINVYLNGNLAASAITSPLSSWYTQIAYGAYLGAQEPSFIGLMDEVAVFNQTLGGQQIQQIYDAFSAGMCKPTLQSIVVAPLSVSLAAGLSLQLGAVGTYSDGTTHDLSTSASWSSSNTAAATVNTVGLATAVGVGNATIAAVLGSQSGSTNLNVLPGLISLQVNPQNPTIASGTSQPFTAIGTFSDGSTQDITTSVSWSSSAPSVVSITTSGLANGIAAGQSTIAATAGVVSGSALLTVTSISIVSITVNPANATVPVGANQAFTALGVFSDGSTQDVTNSANWSSSVPGVATVNNMPGPGGLATGLAPGATVISATSGTVSGSGNLTVSNATMAAIEITPQSPSITIEGAQQFTATGLYTDGSSADLTTTATWASTSATVATISNTSGSQGWATSIGSGTTTISATSGSLTGSTTLAVQDKLVSINVAPANAMISPGANQQFTASGTYLSGLMQDLTNTVFWSSSSANVATITAGGLAISVAPGQTTLNANLGSIQASAGLTVADALGTTRSATVSCPAGGLTGATCYAVTISCPETSDFTGYVKVNYPTSSWAGTVVFTTGGNGTYLYESNFTYGTTLLDTVLQGGFALAQITWGHPFANQPYGWQTGPGGIRAVACRYATMAQWIYTNIHQANSAAPFCATGNSAGAEQIGQAMAHYGLGSIFAMVEPTSGPPFAHQDWACDCLQPNEVNACGVFQSYCLGLGDAQKFVDPAYSSPICSEEQTTHTTTYDATFLHDSVVAPDAILSYPNTFVKFLYGGKDSSTAPNQGQTWDAVITSSKANSCIADADHEIPNALDGAQQIANDILTYCKLPEGEGK